jgi:hypothetical protein
MKPPIRLRNPPKKGFKKKHRRQKGKRPPRGEMARRQQYHMVKMYRLRQIWRHPTMTLIQLIVTCMMYPAYQRLQHMVRQRLLFNKDHNSKQILFQ